MAALQARKAGIDRHRIMLQWIDAHCAIEDDGRDQVAAFQSPDGVITMQAGHYGPVDQKCDAKPPGPLPPWRSGFADIPKIRGEDWQHDVQCAQADAASGQPQPCVAIRCEPLAPSAAVGAPARIKACCNAMRDQATAMGGSLEAVRLQDFGITPPKARTPLSADQQVAAATKRTATRAARHTLGPKRNLRHSNAARL
jgi:hypothetical protein